MATSYDDVLYRGFPYAQSHPDRLATIAKLFGLNPTPLDNCSVLELGCGEGANLLPMAFEFPNSRFVGVDLAETPIAIARKAADELALKNLEFIAADILDLGPKLGTFDYVIAHGVYSWVPEPVRDRLLSLTREILSPNGIAYVSYNAMPGCHLRQMLREIMQFHIRGAVDSQTRIQKAHEILNMLMSAPDSEENTTPALMKDEVKSILERDPLVLFHDELGDVFHPVAFSDFMAHAHRHGLQYLGEATVHAMEPQRFTPELRAKLEEYAGGSRIAREQYMDFLKFRKFRQTLLCRSDANASEELLEASVKSLYAASQVTTNSPESDFANDAVVEFRGAQGAAAKTRHPLPKLALGYLSSVWPETKHFDEVLKWCTSKAGQEQDPEGLAEILLALVRAGLIDLHAHRIKCVRELGAKPKTTELVRWQAAQGYPLTTQRHTTIATAGELERRLIGLLDGTRDRAALIRALGHDSANFATELELNLTKLARFGLLIQ